jgi:hypothetical protein
MMCAPGHAFIEKIGDPWDKAIIYTLNLMQGKALFL